MKNPLRFAPFLLIGVGLISIIPSTPAKAQQPSKLDFSSYYQWSPWTTLQDSYKNGIQFQWKTSPGKTWVNFYNRYKTQMIITVEYTYQTTLGKTETTTDWGGYILDPEAKYQKGDGMGGNWLVLESTHITNWRVIKLEALDPRFGKLQVYPRNDLAAREQAEGQKVRQQTQAKQEQAKQQRTEQMNATLKSGQRQQDAARDVVRDATDSFTAAQNRRAKINEDERQAIQKIRDNTSDFDDDPSIASYQRTIRDQEERAVRYDAQKEKWEAQAESARAQMAKDKTGFSNTLSASIALYESNARKAGADADRARAVIRYSERQIQGRKRDLRSLDTKETTDDRSDNRPQDARPNEQVEQQEGAKTESGFDGFAKIVINKVNNSGKISVPYGNHLFEYETTIKAFDTSSITVVERRRDLNAQKETNVGVTEATARLRDLDMNAIGAADSDEIFVSTLKQADTVRQIYRIIYDNPADDLLKEGDIVTNVPGFTIKCASKADAAQIADALKNAIAIAQGRQVVSVSTHANNTTPSSPSATRAIGNAPIITSAPAPLLPNSPEYRSQQDYLTLVTAIKKKDYATAFPLVSRFANEGDTFAQSYLGLMYMKGLGVTEDFAKAVRYCKLAANQGDAYAQCNLGILYNLGLGVSKDFAEAVRYYKLAADQGNANAQWNLGILYNRGSGVSKDIAEAVRYYKLAATQGHMEAKKQLKELGQEVAE